ncbi:DUF6428 family protein [Shimia sp. NS0008-38b]|uniref:DUF6428 family protein n=1 Tax=Shimia sp. NS0008-38b TaxID=3127653 RepID=UPI003109EBE1
MTSFAKLLAELQGQGADDPLVFVTDEGEIGAGYHVTELRHSQATGIDCGGVIETWQDARLQLLDGNGAAHMRVGKFCAIVEQSLTAVPELADVPLMVEFGHNNAALRLLSIANVAHESGRVVVQLGETGAVCKPQQRGLAALQAGQTAACCVPKVSQSSQCCG